MEFDYDPICGPYPKGAHNAEAHKRLAKDLVAINPSNIDIYGITKEDLE